jgi:hypothetical protein
VPQALLVALQAAIPVSPLAWPPVVDVPPVADVPRVVPLAFAPKAQPCESPAGPPVAPLALQPDASRFWL